MRFNDYLVVRKNTTTKQWQILFRNHADVCYDERENFKFRFTHIDGLMVVSQKAFDKFIKHIVIVT